MHSLVEENYLKALFTLSKDKGSVSVNDLSQHLNIKMPTVTNMMKKMALKKLVHYESYKPLILTKKGKKEAALIIRKHRLTEMYLVEKMGFGWEEVHNIAEQIEHIKSPKLFAKMAELLDYPKFDPHGTPIPDINGEMEWKAYSKLSECKPGDMVKMAAVINTTDEFLKFLNRREIHLGLKIEIKSVESFDNTMVVKYKNHLEETLSNTVCKRLLVEKF
jgi:DtxR family Mn-dependent transcriptional regulator